MLENERIGDRQGAWQDLAMNRDKHLLDDEMKGKKLLSV